jgi:predicted dehydrogenase
MARRISRRKFMGTAMAAAVGPMILPSGVLAKPNRPGPNDRLVVGHIGIGGMGTGHLNFVQGHNSFESGALCDVDQAHLAKAVGMVEKKVPTYTDYRQLLEQKDLDAVIIAAPDHWHGLMTVHACQAEKHVYCEKPLSETVHEGQAMLAAAKASRSVVQVGSQARSTDGGRQAWNWINNGKIGRVTRVECWHVDNPTGGDWTKNGPAPADLDWDMWLGPAQWVPYNPDRVHFNFRWFLDFGGGQIRDRGAHVFNLASWVLGLDDKFPYRVSATGTPPPSGMYNCPQNFDVTIEYKDPDVTLVWRQPGEKAADHDFGAVYHGTSGKLIVRGGDGGTHVDDPEVKSYKPGAGEKQCEVSSGQHTNWLEAIREGKKPIMNIDAGYRIAVNCILANISYRIGRPILWDGRKEQIIDDDAANLMLGTPGRGEYHL